MRLYLPQYYVELIQSRVNWNTLTLVLHRCVILSLVESEFLNVETALCVETARDTARGTL